MKFKFVTLIPVVVILLGISAFTIRYKTKVPRVFSEQYLKDLMVPLADSTIKVIHVPDTQYYALPKAVIYKTYPLYLPGKEPEGYYEKLKHLDPQIAFDKDELNTEGDWIRAGELVYEWGLSVNPLDSFEFKRLERDFKEFHLPVTKEGIIPFFKIVVREKGKLEVTGRSCNTCHTKVMPDGSVLKGGQGNYPFGKDFGSDLLNAYNDPKIPDSIKQRFSQLAGSALFRAPWLNTQAQNRLKDMPASDFIQTILNTYGGVLHRHGTLVGYPTSVPDLYNIENRKYFDHTGLMKHRSIEDLMLYATLNEQADRMDKYGPFTVWASWPSENPERFKDFRRFSDAQLYALAKFIYSLEAPKNPEIYSQDMLSRGEQIFAEQACVTCHTPPLYTNNKLTPVNGFEVPKWHKKRYDIFDISVETDPTLALETRRGTGYYKVPSLIGVWNRQALLHDGSIRSLEDLFDSARLNDDYVTRGFHPAWKNSGAVSGHPFGLDLVKEDKQALIAFLNTL